MLMWTGQKLNPDKPIYNMVYTFDFKGKIEVEHFQNAFQKLIKQSDSLRTIFRESNNEPRQIILPKLDFSLRLINFTDRNSADQDLKEWIEKRSQKVLDLTKCSFDSVLIKITDQRFVWYLNQHHLTTDAHSSSIIYKQMLELYIRSVRDISEAIPPFMQFQSYKKYEKDIEQDVKRNKVNDYWQQKIGSLSSPARLYGRENSENTTSSKRVVVDLGPEKSEILQNLTREKDLRAFTGDLSLFNIFATVLLAYLNRVTNQSKLVFGTPVHNRTTLELKKTPGLFIEFFPFTGQVQRDDTFSSLFKRVSRETFEFLRHARTGANTTDSGRRFNVVLNYINTDFPAFNEIPCEAIWHHPKHSDTSHHLRIHIYNDKNSDHLKIYFDLNCDVFSQELIETVPGHFLKLLEAFIEDRHQPIGQTSILSEAEFQKFVVDVNNHRQIDNKKNVLELFESQVQKNPQALAVSEKKQDLSFTDLDKRSNQLANYLIRKKITNGERVGLYLGRSVDLIVGILGVLKAGCTYIPIAQNNPAERVVEKIENSQAAIVLTHQNLDRNLPEMEASLVRLDDDWEIINGLENTSPERDISPDEIAYIMFTSGSTGKPNGVSISHRALGNYINFAGQKYQVTEHTKFPLFTTIDFDLTVTSIFVPLVTGGSIIIYEEQGFGSDLALLDVIEDNRVEVIKLTPSHLSLLREKDLKTSRIKKMIVGGEDFKTDLAKQISRKFSSDLEIYNEYGPTEATVGCILHKFDPQNDLSDSVPIGKPFAGTQVFILDDDLNPVPPGVTGNLYLAGESLANGYWNNPALTDKKFIPGPFGQKVKMYDTGDLARRNLNGEIEYLGRKDEQVKVGGVRIELGEIEAALAKYPQVESCVVELVKPKEQIPAHQVVNCRRCGLPSNYPKAEFDKNGVCNLCLSFENYQQKAQKYFKTPADLKKIFEETKRPGEYDCLMLLSGGKDSTYALAKLVEMDLRVLAYTLDNGYISEQAKENIRHVVADLKVDHIFGTTPVMNKIFADSLERYSNVCNGCFKTIYTLSIKVALEKKIPYIMTGLSRGQFFETRLTEELFWKDNTEAIDQTILAARKAYHRVNDTVNQLLDNGIFQEDAVFEKVRFLDFYRYFDVEFEELIAYLDEQLPWVRPTDTGRSTNCLINQAGIYVHKKEQGYSNYAFPYSWDVRMGHKTRETSLDEINEEIDEDEVQRMLREVGYIPKPANSEKQLIGYYTASEDISPADLRNYLAKTFPAYMIPVSFRRLKKIPLTGNGKIDRKALRDLKAVSSGPDKKFTAPATEFEEILSGIWTEVLQMEKLSVDEDFFEVGGNSLAAIQIMARVNESFELDLSVNKIFEKPNIRALAEYLEKTILRMLDELEGISNSN
jgi:amino acid adenylation domain-containing protein